jgi:hypothetical protein
MTSREKRKMRRNERVELGYEVPGGKSMFYISEKGKKIVKS